MTELGAIKKPQSTNSFCGQSRLGPSALTPLHAMLAGAVLIFSVSNGFWPAFFSSGPAAVPPPSAILRAVFSQVIFFGGISAVMWISTNPWHRRGATAAPATNAPTEKRRHFIATSLRGIIFATVITATAFAIAASITVSVKALTGIDLKSQDIVQWLKPEVCSPAMRALLITTALFEAPLIEEPLFRGIIFRGLSAKFSPAFSMLISGIIFAIVHVNAAAFIPLVFLGAAFSFAYWKTGTILAPMALHLFFNAVSLALLFSFPSLSA